MWRGLMIVVLLAGCAQLPPTPQDLRAKRFEALPDGAVIYLLRDQPDFSDAPATVWLGEHATVTIYPGTYYRWEVAPGRQRISGFGGDNGAITLQTAPGSIYFVQQRLSPFPQFGQSHFQLVGEPHGRSVVMRSSLAGGQ